MHFGRWGNEGRATPSSNTIEGPLPENEISSTFQGFENTLECQILMRYQRKRPLFVIIKVWGDRINTRFFTGAVFELSQNGYGIVGDYTTTTSITVRLFRRIVLGCIDAAEIESRSFWFSFFEGWGAPNY